MLEIHNYTNLEKVTETRNSAIYRGQKDTSKDTVIIKALKTKNPTPSEIARFRQEYKLIRDLDIEGIIRVLDLIEHKDGLALVLEDFDSVSIKSLLEDKKKFDLKSFLTIAIKIAEALGSVHEKKIIHKDIKPHNILINTKTDTVKITDFGISSEITHENDEIYNPDVIQDSLAYMSPEQTGRMNRTVDYRTDIYSLGVTFYEMLTGFLPFISDDPMSIIHSHIAIIPVHPKEHNPDIPDVISDIIMKLLSKNTEDRYQNGFGLMADLKECQKQLKKNDKIESFEPGRFDISDKFIIPQKLYGREKEIDTLISGFEKICNPQGSSVSSEDNGAVKIMLVAGHSGIGKSALISEIHKPIVARRGYFVSGKYEQFRRDKPYSAIIQAFQGMVKQILAESNLKISTWKENLLQALGPNGRIIIEIIPDIELIIGGQPELAELGPVESRNRFKYVFEKFVSVFPSAEHPVALFLDDLQWADIPSMQLIKDMTASPDINYLYLIGSYRNNEVDETHPLTDTIKDIEKAGIEIDRIDLGPILKNDIKNLIINFMKCTDEQGAALSELIHKKTKGNPFFVIQFMETLYNEKLLELDLERGWKWDIENINQLQVTDNVVELLAGNIDKLPDSVREVLTICAAIGNRFDLETLSFIQGKSIDEVLDNLTLAINEGFVSQSSLKELYIFHHDRLQEAAYSLVPDNQKAELHYRIGKKALEKASVEDSLENKLFYIVDQLNLGLQLITNTKEREDLARLNLDAGIKAKASSAFSSAIQYLETGINFLENDSWENQYELTLSLYRSTIEAASLNGNYDKMDQLAKVALQYARTTLDTVEIISSRAYSLKAQEDFQGSIDTALPVLKDFGIRLPRKPGQLQIFIELLRLKIAMRGKKPKDLLNLPEAIDPKFIASMQIITSMSVSCFFINPNLYAMIMLVSTRLAIKHGVTPDHPFLFTNCGLIFIVGLEDFDGAIEFGELGLKLIDKLDSRKQLSKTLFVHYSLIYHWKLPVKETIAPLKDAYRIGLETGDLDFGIFNLNMFDLHCIYTGKELSELEEDAAKHYQIISGFNQKYIINIMAIIWQLILNFIGECDDPLMMTGKALEGEKMLPLWIREDNRAALSCFYLARLAPRYLYNEYSLALEDIAMFKKYKDALQGTASNRYLVHMDSVSRLMLYPDASFITKVKYRIQTKINQMKMKKWANKAPGNCLHMFHAVEALRAWRIGKNIDRAKKEFEEAARLCKRPDDSFVLVIVLELMGMLYISIGDKKMAKEYMTAAYNANSSWGTKLKMKHLKEKYPELLEDQIGATTKSGSSTDTSIGTVSDTLDFSTAMKASQTISGEIVLERLLVKMIELTMENAGADKGFMLLEENGNLLVEAEKAVGSDEVTVLKSIPVESHGGLSSNIVNYVARTKEILIFNDAVNEGSFTNDPYVTKNKPKSILCLPVISQGRLLGILYLENNIASKAFTSDRIELLKILSSQAAISIENSRLIVSRENEAKLKTEMDIAANIQTSILPKNPQIEGFEITGYMKPADDVGGDYYDVINTESRDWVIIGDVSGHGVPAGLIMMMVQASIQAIVREFPDMKPSEVLRIVNEMVKYNTGNMEQDKYMTITVFSFGHEGEAIHSGLHQDIFLYRAVSEKVEKIPSNGIWLSPWDMGHESIDSEIKMDSGDVLFLYTDGITEAKGKNKEMFSEEKLMDILNSTCSIPTERIRDKVLEELEGYVTDDDVTMMILKKV